MSNCMAKDFMCFVSNFCVYCILIASTVMLSKTLCVLFQMFYFCVYCILITNVVMLSNSMCYGYGGISNFA